ncbi:MAG: sigma-54 dependent transcriptional regulator [Desulfobacteraceae bacterium]|jgi:DNA-binding NtrC family response regulator|nr:sigma-54 dependent transcriptional regulator [Desulfobacteraceae bacterium]
MSSILIVDDDDQLRMSFAKLLTEEGYDIRTAPTGETGVEEVKKKAPWLVIMDVRLPRMNGLEAFGEIRKIDSTLPVIIMTAFGTTDTAIEATKLGAFDYILKPFDIPAVLTLIEQALEAGRLMRSRVEMNAEPDIVKPDVLIGRSDVMQEVYKSIGRVASTDATVLIRGESGTGKELVARAIYQHSKRADKAFLVINCVAIPETLLESELFGYEKGAFTGASNRRVGKIEQANGGTVFLDEIGDMPISIQAKILRLIQERSIERLGGGKPIPVDVRIIAATNRNLEKAIQADRFREDLYYRLKVVSVVLPLLRERQGDIALLCEYFLSLFSMEMNIDNPGMTDKAKGLIENYTWPGNVRELGNAIKKALIFSSGYPIRPSDVSYAISESDKKAIIPSTESIEKAARQWVREILASKNSKDHFNNLMDRFGSVVLSEALSLTGGNRSNAAKMLGMSRPTLQSKLEKYNLIFETSVKKSNVSG